MTIGRNSKLNYAELSYLLFFSVMLLAKGMGLYDGQWPYTLALVIGALLLIIKLILTDHSISERIIILLLIALGIIIYIKTGEKGALINIAIVIGMKGVCVKRTFRLGAVIWISTFILQALFCLTGVREDIFRVQSKLGLGYVFRWSLGYPHPNVLQISLMILSAFVLYLGDLKGKKLIKVSIALFLLDLYGFMYSISFTGIILGALYLGLNIYLSERKRLTTIEKALFIACMPICAAFSILGPLYFPEPLWSICNKVLNTRFMISRSYMELNPLSLFGSGYCDALPSQLNNLDSSYVFALMHYGVIFFALMMTAYISLTVYLVKNDLRNELAITLGLSIAAVSEPFFVNSSFKNISLIFLGSYLFLLSEKLGRSYVMGHGRSRTLQNLGSREVGWWDGFVAQINKYMDKILNIIHAKKRNLVVCGAICAVIGDICFALFNNIPPFYYTDMRNAQVDSEWMYSMEQLPNATMPPEDSLGVLIGHFDGSVPTEFLIIVGNNAPKLEWIRGMVSSIVWGGFGGIILFLLVTSIISATHRL